VAPQPPLQRDPVALMMADATLVIAGSVADTVA
jgi:hypothetical protein